MTIQIVKTKAETALAAELARNEGRLPGTDFVMQLRREAMRRFEAAGLPNRRIEEWKYTDLRVLLKEGAPLATGGYRGEVHKFVEYALWEGLKGERQDGDWMLFADGRQVTANGRLAGQGHRLAGVLQSPPAWVEADLKAAATVTANGVLSLNTALMTDGAVLDIAAGEACERPIHLIFDAGRAADEDPAEPRCAVTRNIIRIGKGAKLTLVESYAGGSSTPRHRNAVTQIAIEEGAEVTHVYQSVANAGSTHLSHLIVKLAANAVYRPFVATRGDGLTRNDISILFQGRHSTFDLGGLALGAAQGHSDMTLVVDHAAPHCTSRELYHSVLAGEAKSVFQGKVIVRPGAQKTDGKQMARALMLSPYAEFDSKPELEIYADDVVCGHGSTSVEIDEDMLFYCRSRGIPLADARALLVESFAGQAAEKLGDETLRAEIMDNARRWLAQCAI